MLVYLPWVGCYRLVNMVTFLPTFVGQEFTQMDFTEKGQAKPPVPLF